jgi:hypothetical protein
MKGMIDSVERKQKIWDHEMVVMFEDAIRTCAKHYPAIAAFVPEDEDWSFTIKWPSVMRSDDPQTITMQINKWNTGATSLETFLEETGSADPSQEIDRLRDEMQDALTAAVRGQRLPLLAEQTINPAPDPNDVPPEIKHTFNWSAALTPEQEANLAFTIPNLQNGPYGPSMGPQGTIGAHAEEAVADEGTLENSKSEDSYGTPDTFDENGDPIDLSQVSPTGAPPGGTNPQGAPNAPPTKGKEKTKGKGKGKNAKPAPGINSNGGTSSAPPLNGPGDNNPAAPGVMSQPGTGVPAATTPAAAVQQSEQNNNGG